MNEKQYSIWTKHFFKESAKNVEAEKAAADWENLQQHIKENVRPSQRLPTGRLVTVERTFDPNHRIPQLQQWPVTEPWNYQAKNFFWETGTLNPPKKYVWSKHLLVWGGVWLYLYWTYFRYSGNDREKRRWMLFDPHYEWPAHHPRSEKSERL